MLRRWQFAQVERPSHLSFRPVGQVGEKNIRSRRTIQNKGARTPAELTCHGRPARDLRLYALTLSVGVVSAGNLHLANTERLAMRGDKRTPRLRTWVEFMMNVSH